MLMNEEVKVNTRTPSYRTDGRRPAVVLGTASLGGAWGQVDREESIDTILYALEQGITRIDTAPAYNRAEEMVADALKQWKGKRPFVSTKVGKLRGSAEAQDLNNYELDVMESSVNRSIELLGENSLDLLFLHEPEKVPDHKRSAVLDYLKELSDSGRARSIGLGGIVTPSYYSWIKEGFFDVIMGFNDLDAACLDALEEQVPLFRSANVTRYQGSILHMGLLGSRYDKYKDSPPKWISKEALENAKKVKYIAELHKLSLPSLAHRYAASIAEIDYLVIGPRNMKQLKSFLDDYENGVLEKGLFEELNKALV